jgi:hypothetical protein
MTIRQKYQMLQDKTTVQKMVVNSVYSTMMMETQFVSKKRLNELYLMAVNEKQLSR